MSSSRTTSIIVPLLFVVSIAGVPAAAALDLPTVLGQVAAANPTIEARRASIEAAKQRVAPAGAWSNPMLEVGLENVPTTGRLDQDPMTMARVGITQRVPISGARGLSSRSADEQVNAEIAAAEMTGFEVLGAAWRAYADAYFAAELEHQAELHRDMMDRMVPTIRSRYESGRGRLEDVMSVEAERARATADIAMFAAEERAARARIDALRGRSGGEFADSLSPPPVSDVAVATGWPVVVDARHPRLRELAARTQSYRLAGQAAKRRAWPELELRGSYGFRQDLAHEVGHTEPQDDMFSASVGLMLPLFRGSSDLGEGGAMEGMARASESEYRAAELALIEQVTAIQSEAGAAQRRARLLADTVVVMYRKALDATWSSYSAGQTDVWRVFESAHALYQEELAATRARQQLAAAQANLVSTTGRGDLFGVELPVVEVKR